VTALFSPKIASLCPTHSCKNYIKNTRF